MKLVVLSLVLLCGCTSTKFSSKIYMDSGKNHLKKSRTIEFSCVPNLKSNSFSLETSKDISGDDGLHREDNRRLKELLALIITSMVI